MTRLLPVILGALAAFGPLATDIYLPAFPAIAAGLAADSAAVQATLAAFFAGMSLAQLIYGPIADRFGRRLPLLTGLIIFTTASLGCFLAGDIRELGWMRFCQGLGGCAGMVMARAIVRDIAEGPAAIRLMSQLTLVMGLAPILAPTIGSILLLFGNWRMIFLLLAGYSALLAVVVTFALPETLPPDRRRHAGLPGIAKTYLGLLGNRHFMAFALAATLPVAGMFAYIGGSPFVFMSLHGISTQGYALFFGANACGIMLLSRLNTMLTQRWGAETVLRAALAAMASAGVLLLLTTATGLGGFLALAGLLFAYVAGVGCVMPLGTILAMGPQAGQAGSASAVIGTLQFGLGAIAGSLVGLLHDGTAVPMALVIAACGLSGWLALRQLTR